jgi:hypothetical protein
MYIHLFRAFRRFLMSLPASMRADPAMEILQAALSAALDHVPAEQVAQEVADRMSLQSTSEHTRAPPPRKGVATTKDSHRARG